MSKPRAPSLFVIVPCLLLVAYGVYGVATDDIYLPGRRGEVGEHLHGMAAWALFGGICALSGVIMWFETAGWRQARRKD